MVEHRSKKIAIGKLCRGVSINQTVTWHSKKKVSGVPPSNSQRIVDRRSY
ncbi:MAG: hypothetical protein QS721_06050 [Candidatus Endonucleobacter sp. (ex Gigantidas childressi)]|nr:hypothetical protein [Candidatus Endonucleobacter sp. (ex Gigantidas childressi)]